MSNAIAIAIGAILGALVRWKFGEQLNPLFPTLPLGTLAANLIGCFIMGSFIFLTREHSFFSSEMRLGAITGFLGALTTFSTFSAETFVLISRGELFWVMVITALHVGGSLFLLSVGYSMTKLLLKSLGG